MFQDTRKLLRVGFFAMWFVTSQKNGGGALGLQRVLGLGSYETAWTWLHKLRRAMVRPGRDRRIGAVEVDEIYVGGREKSARGRETGTKSIVVAAVDKERSRRRPHPSQVRRGCFRRQPAFFRIGRRDARN